MNTHDYSPQEALDLLMRKLHKYGKKLGDQIQAAVDAGKDIEIKEPVQGRNKKQRGYRKTVQFSEEEALQVALNGLQAYFVELPYFIYSAMENFNMAGVGKSAERGLTFWTDESQLQRPSQRGVGSEKVLEIELQTETQISKADKQTLRLHPVSKQEIDEQKAHMDRLAELL